MDLRAIVPRTYIFCEGAPSRFRQIAAADVAPVDSDTTPGPDKAKSENTISILTFNARGNNQQEIMPSYPSSVWYRRNDFMCGIAV